VTRPPSVDAVARALRDTGLPHPLLVDAARRAVVEARDGGPDAVHALAAELARRQRRRLLQPVINGTGVLLHTNLGRAPLAHHQDAGYSNLELRLDDGRRGSRSDHVATLVARACEAEAGLVVNNTAAAVLLSLSALSGGRAAAVSRGELVEIGGGFRIPEVMAASGARMIEVGTTNRTRRADFERAVAAHPDLTVLLKVHQSNYRIVGFTEAVEVPDLAGLGPAVVADIGSGLLDAACPWLRDGPPAWLAGEPAARQTLAAGADLVLFSGDKLLGGPQAGIIVGRADLVQRCAGHPLARAVRPGGLVLAALQDVVLAYLDRRGDDIPFWRMAATPVEDLRRRADAIVAAVAGDRAGPPGVASSALDAVPGGGTLPEVTIPSWGLTVAGDHSPALRERARPLIARVADRRTVVDLRTVDPGDDPEVIDALAALAPVHR
jgi:L-seryl-tRNA(Ser) seleniumtransferase